MKKLVLMLIAIIGAYTLARNNIRVLTEQTTWITHPDIFYKFFIPFLMIFSAIFSLIYREKTNLFYLSFFTMLIDAVNRLSVFVNVYFMYFAYGRSGPMKSPVDATVVRANMAPSLMMLLVEIAIAAGMLIYVQRLEKTEASRA